MRIEESQRADQGKPAATAEQILGEIRDYCRATQTAESTFGRLVVNDGKLVSRLRDGARITTGTLDKVRVYLSEHRAMPSAPGETPPDREADQRRRRRCDCAAWLPILRQPPKVPAVRLDLQREDRDRQPDFARARQFAAGAAGASHLRCRGRRRHGAVAGDAGGPCPLPDHAALCRGQGNQLRGRPPDAREDGGPPVRTSRHRARDHQPLLRRGAMADAALGDGGPRA